MAFRLRRSSLLSRCGINHFRALSSSPQPSLPSFSKSDSLYEFPTSLTKLVPCRVTQLGSPFFERISFQRFGFSSSASPQTTDKEANQSADDQGTPMENDKTSENLSQGEKDNKGGDLNAPELAEESDMELDLSVEDLVKLVAEKEALLQAKHKELEAMHEKVLRSYAEMENIIERTRRESENSKKFAIQSFAKTLLDVADNLERAVAVGKDNLSKIDASTDSGEAARRLKELVEGVEMTVKQLVEVFRKFGVEKYDPSNEQFDPNRHYAVVQVPDASKPSGTIAAVLKTGYMLHDRIIRPAEVAVVSNQEATTEGETDQNAAA